MRASRGDVVLVDFPYSDRTGSKVRPCLIVQCDRNNQRLDDTIVVTITSRRFRSTEPSQLQVDVTTPAGQQSGLLHTSTIQCENLVTVDCSFVHRKIGKLPPELMSAVDD